MLKIDVGDFLKEILDLEKIKEKNIVKDTHVSSRLQADTLFTFCDKLDYIITPLKLKSISARYCEENIEYLNIKKMRKICFPMKCFCDINLHRIGDHLSCYGCYGLAFTKSWGMQQGIQPIQYFNPNSALSKDYRLAFSRALCIDKNNQTENELIMKNYLAHQLMYYKPYSGVFKNRVTGEEIEKCYMDECEWRYVPKVSDIEYKQIYCNEEILNRGGSFFKELSDSMIGQSRVLLTFNYNDLKYIIIKNMDDFSRIVDEIEHFDIKKEEKQFLISKIIIWEFSGGDF